MRRPSQEEVGGAPRWPRGGADSTVRGTGDASVRAECGVDRLKLEVARRGKREAPERGEIVEAVARPLVVPAEPHDGVVVRPDVQAGAHARAGVAWDARVEVHLLAADAAAQAGSSPGAEERRAKQARRLERGAPLSLRIERLERRRN